MPDVRLRPRRSVLYVPAASENALAKAAALSADAVIFDLEDSAAPEAKVEARERLKAHFATVPRGSAERVIRINALASEWGADDLAAAVACGPDAILLPKVETPRDIRELDEALDEMESDPQTRLWAMVETPRAMLNLGSIAELGRDNGSRLVCLVAGTNDLVAATGVLATPDRRYIAPWLGQIVLAARAGGLAVLDGPYGDFRDAEGFARACAESAAMGFDGRTLIHPSQVEPANAAFSPSPEAVAEARAVVAAFALPENAGSGVIAVDGRMVERLHLAAAERLLAKAGATSSTGNAL